MDSCCRLHSATRGLLVAGSALLLVAAGCGKKSSAKDTSLAEGSDIKVSGQLALDSSSSLASDGMPLVNVDDLKVYCVTFAVPPVAGTGEVGSDGSFSVALKAAQQAFGCFVLKGTEQLATLVFQNTEEKSIDGESKEDSRVAFSTDANLGSIKLNTKTGKAVADVKNFKEKLKTAVTNKADAFDFTGSWKLSSLGTNLPDGYSGTCSEASQQDGSCRGPKEGEEIWINRIAGKKFKPDQSCKDALQTQKQGGGLITTCNGETSNDDAFAIALWASKASFEACGSKLGFRYIDAKASANMDLSSSGVAEGPLTWSAGWDDGWKKSTATAQWNMGKCEQTSVGEKPAQKCSYNGGTRYVINGGEGCKDSDGKPFKMGQNDWSSLTWSQGGDLGSGMRESVGSGTINGTAVTCKNIHGAFLADGTAANQDNTWTQDGAVTQGQLCSSITGTSDSEKVVQLQCYLNAYFQDQDRRSPTACVRKVRANWQAKKPSEFFVRAAGPATAESQIVFSRFEYTSPTTGTFRFEERSVENLRGGGSSGDVACEVMEASSITMKKISDTEIQMEMISEQRTTSLDRPACKAEYGENGQVMKSMFKATKQ